MGLLDFLSPAATVLGREQDRQRDLREQERQQRVAEALRLQAETRQSEQDDLARMVKESQMRLDDARTKALGIQKPNRTYDSARGAMIDQDTGEARPVTGLPDRPAATETPHTVNAQEGIMQWDAATRSFKPTGLHPVPPQAPQASFTPITVAGADQNAPPVVRPFNTRTGQAGAPIAESKPGATRIESAMNTAAKARLEAAVSEMNNAHAGMAAYEQELKAGTANINGLQQFAGRVANSFTHDDPLSMTIQSGALAALNRTNPKLARYIRRALSFAEGESMISQRPSDFRTKMAAFLSAAASGASPEMIADIESRRTSILNPLNATVTPSHATSQQSQQSSAARGGAGDAEAAWAAKNPPHPGESFEAYHARYLSGGRP